MERARLLEKEREKRKELKRQLMDAGWKIEELRQEVEATRCGGGGG